MEDCPALHYSKLLIVLIWFVQQPYLQLRQITITNVDTFLSDNSINLYVQYGFVNNPLVVQSVQLSIGKLPQSSLVSSALLSTV